MEIADEIKKLVYMMNESEAIKDVILLRKGLIVLSIVLIGFLIHGYLHYEPATVALFGAGLLMLLAGIHDPHHIFAEIEWGTIFFFIGLFIMTFCNKYVVIEVLCFGICIYR